MTSVELAPLEPGPRGTARQEQEDVPNNKNGAEQPAAKDPFSVGDRLHTQPRPDTQGIRGQEGGAGGEVAEHIRYLQVGRGTQGADPGPSLLSGRGRVETGVRSAEG